MIPDPGKSSGSGFTTLLRACFVTPPPPSLPLLHATYIPKVQAGGEAEPEDIHEGLDSFFGKKNVAAAVVPPGRQGTPLGSPLLEEHSSGVGGAKHSASRSREDVRERRAAAPKVSLPVPTSRGFK